MHKSNQKNGYSAEIRLELRTEGCVFELASVGPNHCIPRNPIELDACDAQIAMYVDERLFVWPVRIPHKIVPFDTKIVMQLRGEMQRICDSHS